MDNQAIYNRLTELTEGLLYVSETESEFSVYEVEPGEAGGIDSMMEDIAGTPMVAFKEENYTIFFEKLIAGLAADPGMQEQKKRYEELFTYLQVTFANIRIVTAGDVERHIFIVCTTGEGEHFLLYTLSIES